MKEEFAISIYLDTRRALKEGKYPVKLKVYLLQTTERKYFNIGFNMTEDEFSRVWETQKPKNEFKELQFKLKTIEHEAITIAKEIKPFNIEVFEKTMFGIKFDKENVIEHYELAIKKLQKNGQISTASNYSLSLKSIINFIRSTNNKELLKISFHDINKDFLEDYERFMLNDLKRSRTTVSMYVRALRTIFNKAINDNTIDKSIYPFGSEDRNLYTPPSAENSNRALTDNQLKILFEGNPLTTEQEKAKAFWFFSYICNGINMKDILNLKYKDMQSDMFTFYRAKTIRTKKDKLKPVKVYLTDFAKQVIEQYGNRDRSDKNYIFPILDISQSNEIQRTKTQNFTRFVNQHFKKYALSLGVEEKISSYWARHSFATRAIRMGFGSEYVKEALNHSNLKTTENYIAKFPDELKKDNAKKLISF
jgi:integrase/recombinase XerD